MTDEPHSSPPSGPAGAPRRRRRRRGRRGSGPGPGATGAAADEAGSAKPEGVPRAGDRADAPPHGRRGGGAGGARESTAQGAGIGREAAPREPRPRDGGPRDRGPRRRGRRNARPAAAEAAASPPPIVPSVSRLVESSAASELLAPAEVDEMKEHLAFIREYKDALRLRLNAAEDLLVNGRREPDDRGVCRHLLGKIDRSVIEGAAGREPLKSNLAARARMLAGAIRLTADVGVLLAWLETLAQQRSHAEAAEAFAEVVRRIDFESLSATRLARLLQVLTETFSGQERVQVLFGLLDGDAFRRAFDAAASVLPPEVAVIFAPLRAVHRRLRGESPDAAAGADPAAGAAGGRSSLAVGLEQVMAAPDPVLRAYFEPLRVRMLELALDPAIPPALADRAAGVLLTSLARTGKTFVRLAMRRAAQLLARHVDDRARATLEEVRRAAPGHRAAEQWLEALAARHMGRIALTAPPAARGRLAAGIWLDGQRPVWIRTAPAAAADALAAEAELQATLALPGVAPVVEHGVASGIPYVAVAAPGRPWQPGAEAPARAGDATPLPPVAQAARILRALALAGVALPDAEPERFCLAGDRAPHLVLADLDGARATARDEAEAVNVAAAAALAHRLAPSLPVADSTTLPSLVHALDRALLVGREP